MSEYISGALTPFANAGTAVSSMASLLLPQVGNVKLRADVRPDGFGRGAIVSRHPVKTATSLFKIRFTYAKNRSAMVTTNVFQMVARTGQYVAAEAEKSRHHTKYSKDDLIHEADKHAMEQKFELKTRLIIPLELTLDLTPYVRINQREYEEYKIRLEAGLHQDPPVDIGPYTGPALTDYLAIGATDLHLGAHVNLVNANDEPFEMFADVIPDDHVSDSAGNKIGRYIRVIIQVRDLGFRGIGKIEESYDLKFLVRSDFTWDLVDEQPPPTADEATKRKYRERLELRDAHFSFGDQAIFPKAGSQELQQKLNKPKIAPPSTINTFVLDPDLRPDTISEDQKEELIKQVYTLALHNQKEAALGALSQITRKTLIPYPAVALGRYLKKLELNGVPTNFFYHEGAGNGWNTICWIANHGVIVRSGKEAFDLAIKAGGHAATESAKIDKAAADKRIRSLLTTEFGENQEAKILFLVRAAGEHGIHVNHSNRMKLRDLFKLIANEAKRQGPAPSTTLNSDTVDRITIEQIVRAVTDHDNGRAYTILMDYMSGANGKYPTICHALEGLLIHSSGVLSDDQVLEAVQILSAVTTSNDISPSAEKTVVLNVFDTFRPREEDHLI